MKELGKEIHICLLTTLIWLSIPVVSEAGIFARPYALAICCSLFAIRSNIRYYLSYRYNDLMRSIVWALIAANVHIAYSPLVALMLIPIFKRPIVFQRTSLLKLLSFTLLLPLLALQPILLILKLFSRNDGQLYTLIGTPDLSSAVSRVLPSGVFFGLLIGFIINFLINKYRLYPQATCANQTSSPNSTILFFCASLTIVPPLLNYAMYCVFNQSIFFPRHFAYYSIGLVVLVSFTVEALRTNFCRCFCCTIIVMLCNLQTLEELQAHYNENFREAVKFINTASLGRKTVSLAMTGYVESADLNYISDPSRVKNLLAPVRYYKLSTPYRLIPTLKQYPFRPELIEYTNQQIDWALELDPSELFIISTYNLVTNVILLNCQLIDDCLAKPYFRNFGNVSVMQFHVLKNKDGAPPKLEAVKFPKDVRS